MQTADIADAERTTSSDLTSKNLMTLRMLMIPLGLLAALLLPFALLASVMITDSGTQEAINLAMMAIAAVIAYPAGIIITIAVWDKRPQLASVILALLAFLNLAGLVVFPKAMAVVATIPLQWIGPNLGNHWRFGIGVVVFGVFAVIVPAVSAWALWRHAHLKATSA